MYPIYRPMAKFEAPYMATDYTFSDVRLDGRTICEANYQHCTFVDASFMHATLRNCKFLHCIFPRLLLSTSYAKELHVHGLSVL